MLLYFKVRNYKSIRDWAVLDMEAAKLRDQTENLIGFKHDAYLPVAAIYGKNGGGKTNIIRAMWLAVQFICNAQRTQVEHSPVPVRPFALNDYSYQEPTAFEFGYVQNGIKYVYGFSATRESIVSEYLKAWPNGREKKIFSRTEQHFDFSKNSEEKMKRLIGEAVAPNQLFFAIACVMNYKPCIEAMQWFREKIVFSRDYTDLNYNLIEYREDENMLQAIASTAKAADVGIQDVRFEIDNEKVDIDNLEGVPAQVQDMVKALRALREALRRNGNEAEIELNHGKLKTMTFHHGVGTNGESGLYQLMLSDESDGTRRIMSLAPAIERTLSNGGVLVVDELEETMHVMLTEYIIERYQQKCRNLKGAQLIFTTHQTALLDQSLLRRDQVYFIDKNSDDGASKLYSLADFNVRNDMDIQKAYMLGKFGAVPSLEGGY